MNRRHFTNAVTFGAAAALVADQTAIAQPPPQPTEGFVTPANAGRFGERTVLYGSSPNDIKVSGSDTRGHMAVFEYAGDVRGGPPLHVHPDQDEVFFITQGDYLFQVGDARHRLGAVGTIFLPRNIPHTFAQLSDAGRMLFIFTPAGRMEDYFRALAALAGPLSEEAEADLFAVHGMVRVGPGLAIDEDG